MEIKYFVGIKFAKSSKSYFFGTDIDGLQIGDKVVADSIRGIQIGTVTEEPKSIQEYKSQLELKEIVRKATNDDIFIYQENAKRAQNSIKITIQEIEKLNLDMHPIDAEYALDGSKLTITYVADDRIDFRELLKVLASRFHCRIELRQIGSRDKAKSIGGIGICGLPLCCATFLNDMEGISINRAKNQMLSLNIPKLSGHCGKLICCLLYEDDAYTDLKKTLPRLGETFKKDGIIYKITSINVLSRELKIEAEDDIQFVPYEDIKKYLNKPNHEKPEFSKQ